MFVALMVLAALQSSFFPFIRLSSGQPNLVFLLVVAWAIDADWNEAMLWTVVGGLCQDLLSIAPIGTSILPLVLAVFAVKMALMQVEGLSFIVYMGVVVVGTLLALLFLFVMLGVSSYGIDPVPTVRYFLLPSLAYQTVVAVPMYFVARWLNRKAAPRRSLMTL
jgi:rod shape-determining protein MreD